MDSRPVAEMVDLTMRWGGKPILDQVNLTVQPGERLVVVGPSGAGKSTILRLLAGPMCAWCFRTRPCSAR
jgi:phospholipid/cholesterol/gamma-HCH transport system ATP-binding protein